MGQPGSRLRRAVSVSSASKSFYPGNRQRMDQTCSVNQSSPDARCLLNPDDMPSVILDHGRFLEESNCPTVDSLAAETCL